MANQPQQQANEDRSTIDPGDAGGAGWSGDASDHGLTRLGRRRREREAAQSPAGDAIRVKVLPATDRAPGHDLVQSVLSAGRGRAGATVLLQRVCDAVSTTLGFDVTAVRYHEGAGEVSDVASSGICSALRNGRRRVTSVSLLVEAMESRDLVLGSAGSGEHSSSSFAFPLMGTERCLGFLVGDRRGSVTSVTEASALAIAGAATAALLEDVLAREELEQGDVLKSEFVALAAHELRDPLASIYGVAVTLDERGETLTGSDRLALQHALRQQTARARNLVEQLLDLSRFDLAALQVSPEPIRLLPKIEEFVRSHPNVAADEVQIAVPPDLELVVDPMALERMLSNLIANALRYGAPPVTITAGRHNTHLRLAVEDRGDGVDPDFVPQLFERFRRGPQTRNRSEGSGLGLAIVQAYARAHGGDILYQAAVPNGARFELVLPLQAFSSGDAG